jgi:long-chain acyl-CoA synthetase
MNLATLAEKNLAEYGEYQRLLFEGKSYTNRELYEAGSRLAAAFVALGMRPGDRVVVTMPNCPEVFVTYHAVWRAGMTIIPVLFVLEARELQYILENSGAKAVVTAPEMCTKVATAVHAAQGVGRSIHVVVTGAPGATPAGCLSLDELVAKSPLSEIVPRDSADLATVLYTSGTTGHPKGVMQTHGNIYANAMNGWNTSTRRERGEMTLLVLPLAHTFGLSVLVSGYLFGSRGVLMRRFDPERALELIQRHKVKAMSGVPTMFVYMLMHPNAHRYDTSSVTRWLVGAAPMPTEQQRQFEKKFGGQMYVGYGLSEASPGIAVEREGMPRKLGSTGKPSEGVEVKIVDDDGHELPRGQVGEICARGDNISPGYYEDPEATAETFRDGWLFTGDLGTLDDDGYLFIVGRKKDLIIRGGLNIYPKDVEEIIHRHPAVLEAAVVGVPDTMMGEEVCAYVVKRPGAAVSAEEIVRHCQSALAKYKTPRYVEIVDQLPKTTLGKIQKKELRKLAAAKFAR